MKRLEIYLIVLSSLLGFLAFFLPVLFVRDMEIVGERISFITLVSHTVENTVPLPTAALLFAVGFSLGTVGPRVWWLVGLSTMFIFPIVAICEMIISPTSHNLWPFEFLLYGLFSIPAIIGSFVGSRISLRKIKPHRKRTEKKNALK